MPDQEHGRLDNAIDRAVRGMMQIDPRAGLTHRVAERLHTPARRALWVTPAFAAAALAVAIFAGIPLLRAPQPPVPAEPPIAAAPSRPFPVTPSIGEPAPATPPRSSVRNEPVPADSIFGPRRGQVTATSVPAPGSAAEGRGGPTARPSTGAGDRELIRSAPIAIDPIDAPRAASGLARSIVQTPAGPPADVAGRPEPAQALNVRIEITILEQTGQAAPAKKVVTLLTSDRQNGSIRSGGTVRAGEQRRAVAINVDARPTLLRENSMRLDLALEYQPQVPAGIAAEPGLWTVKEHVNVVVESARPLLVSETFDPTSDRRVTVEVKATVVR